MNAMDASHSRKVVVERGARVWAGPESMVRADLRVGLTPTCMLSLVRVGLRSREVLMDRSKTDHNVMHAGGQGVMLTQRTCEKQRAIDDLASSPSREAAHSARASSFARRR